MNILNNLKISTKLIGGFGLTGLLLLVGTLIGYLSGKAIETNLTALYDTNLNVTEQALRLAISAGFIQDKVTNAIQQGALGGISTEISTEINDVDTLLKRVKNAPGTPATTALMDTWAKYQADVASLRANPQSSGESPANEALRKDYIDFLNTVDTWEKNSVNRSLQESRNGTSSADTLGILMLSGGAIGILGALGLGAALSININRPIQLLVANMRNLSLGQVDGHASGQVRGLAAQRRDELGMLSGSLVQVEEYMNVSARAAQEIAAGNLTVSVQPRSSEDALGAAMSRMIQNLNSLAKEVAGSSQAVAMASQQLLQAADQTHQVSTQISTTIQQVAAGINQQSGDLSRTMSAIEQTTRSIQRVSDGTQEQKQAVHLTDQTTNQMNSAIQETLHSNEMVAQLSDQSTQKAREGVKIVHQVISSIDSIQEQVARLGEKVAHMGTRSLEIGGIVETIEDIASKTNILAINATIEAAHAKTQVKALTEAILNQMMVTQCQMLARLLTSGFDFNDQQFWTQLGNDTILDTILVTDASATVVMCNEPKLVGWRFPNDPQSQTYPFCQLINQKNGIYCQESQPRSLDNQIFKYVGISRLDQPGVIQVGYRLETLSKFNVQIEGFTVVAEEVYKLAEQSRGAAGEIRKLVARIQETVKEAEQAMKVSLKRVEGGKEQTDQAGNVLETIVVSTKNVFQQAQAVLISTTKMQDLARTLTSAVETVSRVVEQNASSAGSMSENYTRVAGTMESIASLSQENSAAAEEVAASTQEMRSQMENVRESSQSLAKLADDLQKAVHQFHLN